MKLSNQQVEALISKIQKQQQYTRNEEVEKEISKPELIKEAKRIIKILESLPTWAGGRKYTTLKPVLLEIFRNSGVKLKTSIEDYHTIKNKIILATIDSATLDELFTKLNIEQ